ncbi:MAG: TOBE domain-containing protein [Hyphomicrobiaceae bacterium]|nr:TOBE domain-containing protein [Hyphomicrobiaceae bacterium]
MESSTKFSARSALKGKVAEIKKGAVAAQVKVDVGGGNVITSTVTVDAVDELKLQTGSEVAAVIKVSEAILAVD